MATRWSRIAIQAVRRAGTVVGERPILNNSALASSNIKDKAQPLIKPIPVLQHPSGSPTANAKVPTKEKLLRIDWMIEKLTPEILKSRLTPFFDICKQDVHFEDQIYNYKLNQRSQLHSHIAKIRMYYRYLSPYNKVEPKLLCVEGALDIHVTAEGEIYKIINRKITAADREGARVMAKIKEDQESVQKKEEEKHLKELGEAYVDEQKRHDRL